MSEENTLLDTGKPLLKHQQQKISVETTVAEAQISQNAAEELLAGKIQVQQKIWPERL